METQPDALPFVIELLNTGGALVKIVNDLADGLAANGSEEEKLNGGFGQEAGEDGIGRPVAGLPLYYDTRRGPMNAKLISMLTVLAGIAIAPANAVAAAPVEQPSASSSGIIAILIGQVHAQPFTPPIGTDKGSFVSDR
jgi:hypothetical protein